MVSVYVAWNERVEVCLCTLKIPGLGLLSSLALVYTGPMVIKEFQLVQQCNSVAHWKHPDYLLNRQIFCSLWSCFLLGSLAQ